MNENEPNGENIDQVIYPPNSDFLNHTITPGEKILVGGGLFEDKYLTVDQVGINVTNKIFDSLSKEDYVHYLSFLGNANTVLSDAEAELISKIASTVVKFNGGQISESYDPVEINKRRNRAYFNTDIDIVANLSSFQDRGIVACAEASVISQIISHKIQDYHIARSDVVSMAEDKEHAGSHSLNFLINNKTGKVILFDLAYGEVKEKDGKKLLVPFVAVLTDDQKTLLENGKNTVVSSVSDERTYRIGTPFTPSGTWKGHKLTV